MQSGVWLLNIFHIFNDGYQASFLLMLPFIASDLSINLTQIGSLGSFFYLFETVLAIPTGHMGERINGLSVVLVSAVLVGIAFFGLSFVSSYAMLIVFFVIAGIGFALFHPMAFALIAGWSAKGRRGRSVGDFTAIGDVGRIGLPVALTILVAAIGWRNTSLAYAGAVFVFFVCAGVIISKRKKTLFPATSNEGSIGYMHLLKNKRFVLACLTSLLDSAASSSLFIFLPFLLIHKGIDASVLGSFTAAYFVGNFAGKSVIGRIADKRGSVKTFIICEVLMAIFIILLTGASSLTTIIAFSVMLGFLSKGTIPARSSMVIEAVEHHGRFEKSVALLGLIASIGTASAPLLYGYIADTRGITVSFYAAAILALLAIIPAIAFRKVAPAQA